MASPSSLIDATIAYYDGTSSPEDLLASKRRAFLLTALQHTYNIVWMMREWPGTIVENTVTIGSGSVNGELPAGFLRFGTQGGLYEPSRHHRLTEEQQYVVSRLRNQVQQSGAYLDIFAIYDHRIQVPFASTTDRTFIAVHQRTPDPLVDDATDFEAWILPYAETVLLPGLVMRGQQLKADARRDWMEQWNAGIALMVENERPQQTTMRKPPMTRGMW